MTERMTERMTDRQTRKVKIRVAKAERSRTKINYQHIARIPVCVGERWGVVGGGGTWPPFQKSGKYFSGNYQVKFGHLVNFAYIYSMD